MLPQKTIDILNFYFEQYNTVDFIDNDPISIPHQFTLKQDIEIAGFFVAILSWGLRKTIINKSKELMMMMDNTPYDFILNHTPKDLKPFEKFVHRTFNGTDALYCISFFKQYYNSNNSLENIFINKNIEQGLIDLNQLFFSLDFVSERTKKHIATPERKSTCKRLNMYLRWMVRQDKNGVDFGIWKNISPSILLIPLDIHVENIALQLGLIDKQKRDWNTVVQLTQKLQLLDKNDPVKYDFALFGIGINKEILL